MGLISIIFFLFVSGFYAGLDLFAQDSAQTYKLKEITISGEEFIEPKPISVVKRKYIYQSDANSVSEIAKYIPSLKRQTNSRGESQLFLRGYGVRQLALFFDDIPLSIPWDNRIDLSLIPTEMLSSIMVFGGTPSVLFGANTLGGVISIKSFSPGPTNLLRSAGTQFGSNSYRKYFINYSNYFNRFSYFASLSYVKSGDFKLPGTQKDVYNNSIYRLNSHRKKLSAFFKINYSISENSKIGLSSSLVDAQKGVPPETNVGKPRFWKIPLWRKLDLILNGDHNLGRAGWLKYSFSVTKFNMRIDQFTNETYLQLANNEEDNDFTVYGRAVYSLFIAGFSELNISTSSLSSVHKEKFLNTNSFENTFSQNIFSLGTEYEIHQDKFSFLAGFGLDNQYTPRTGGKPKQKNQTSVNFKTKFNYFFSDKLSTQLVYGKKTRFPTLRELYSDALGRFVPNPNLSSESVYNLESDWKYIVNQNIYGFSIFYSLLNNGIQRIALPENQFKRINKDKIRKWGFELNSKIILAEKVNLNFNVSYLNSFAKNKDGEFNDTLEYKPQVISGLQLNYSYNKNLDLLLEMNYISKEFGLKEGSQYFQKLPSYFLLNMRIAYRFELINKIGIETFLRVNNIFDKLYYTQWGLPEPGREFLFGLNFDIK